MITTMEKTLKRHSGYQALENCDIEHYEDKDGQNKEDEATTYTIQEAIDHMGFGWFQIKVSILTGICWMSESMELMLLAILGPVLLCDWSLSSWQQASLSAAVLLGMAMTASFYGSYSEKYGRKVCLVFGTSLAFYFGMLTSIVPNYLWLAFCRFLVGCALGTLPQALTLYSEFLPTKSRAACLIFIEIFYALGASLEVVLAKFIIPVFGWRWWLVASAMPLVLFIGLCYFLPESVRYRLASGDYEKATAMLQQISRENGKPLPPGVLCTLTKTCYKSEERGKIKDLFHPKHRLVSVLLICQWATSHFMYFGMSLLVPTLFAHPDGCHGYDIGSPSSKTGCRLQCAAFSDEDYTALAITGFADFPGLLFTVALMMLTGRKSSLALTGIMSSLVIAVCNLCVNRAALTTLMFVSRALVTGISQGVYVYTSEVYPTPIRALGMGVCNTFGRTGALLSPLLAQVGTEYSAYLGITGFVVFGVMFSVAALLLPVETLGKSMTDEN